MGCKKGKKKGGRKRHCALAAFAAAMLVGCEGQSTVVIPASIFAMTSGQNVSAEPISITSTGQTVLLNAVHNEASGEVTSYVDFQILPSALSNVTATRNDTEFGADVRLEATESEQKVGLWAGIAGLIGTGFGWLLGSGAAPL